MNVVDNAEVLDGSLLKGPDRPNCLVCTAVIFNRISEPERQNEQRNLTCWGIVCEFIGLKEDEGGAILAKFGNPNCGNCFCEKCLLNLEMFRQLQIEMNTLTLQISSVKKTLSEDLCLNNTTKPKSKLRACLANEYAIRRGNNWLTPECIPGDTEYSPLNVCDPVHEDEFPSEDSTGNVIARLYGLKPCHVKLEKIDITSVSRTRDIERTWRNKKHLQKLLNRQSLKKSQPRRDVRHDGGLQRTRTLDSDTGSDLQWLTSFSAKRLFQSGGSFHSSSSGGSAEVAEVSNGESDPAVSKSAKRTKDKLFFNCPRPNCKFRCRVEEFVRFHVRGEHEGLSQIPFNCLGCDAAFNSLRKLRHHERDSNHSTVSFKCHRRFRRRHNYKVHLQRQGGGCPGGELSPLNGIYDASQHTKKPYICAKCGTKFRSPYYLRTHVYALHANDLTCELCSKRFKSKVAMIRHLRATHPEYVLVKDRTADEVKERLNKMTCETCQKTFQTIKAKRIHVIKFHTKAFNFYCEVCGSGWVNKRELKRHSLIHLEKKEQCPHCDYKWNKTDRPELLANHIKRKHGTGLEKKFICEHCAKPFATNTHLKQHLTVMHMTDRDPTSFQFKCDLCNYSTVQLNNLRVHSRSKKHQINVVAAGLDRYDLDLQYKKKETII